MYEGERPQSGRLLEEQNRLFQELRTVNAQLAAVHDELRRFRTGVEKCLREVGRSVEKIARGR